MKPSRNDPCPCGSGKKYKHCCERKADALPTLPLTELNQLQLLFNASKFAEVEACAVKLLERFPEEPAVWKLFAMALQMQGKAALPAFQKTAELMPSDAGAYMNLGNALQDAARLNEAASSYQHALDIKPSFAEAHNSLGGIFATLGQLDEAAASYRRAVQIKPNYAAAHSSLGGILRDLGRLEEATISYRRAIKVQPNFVEAHNNLGITFRDLGQLDQAVASYRQVLKFEPDNVAAHSNLGVVFRDLGQCDNAVVSFHRALELNPNDAEVLSNLGLTLHDLGQFDGAITCYRDALKISPNHAETYNNLGLTLHAQGRYDEAVVVCRKAIALQPNFAEAHNNLGNAFNDSGQLNDALNSYRTALEIKPDFAEALNNIGGTLKDTGEFAAALSSFYRAIKIKPDYAAAHSNLLFSLSYTANTTPRAYLNEAVQYGKMVSEKIGSRYMAWLCEPHPQSLRVGMISGDFSNHPVGYFTESLLAQLSLARVELIAYTNNPIADELTSRIKPCFAHWREVFGLSDEATAQLIHNDGIHVLLDLSGHTAKNRLPVFAWKPAPVQATWLGYFSSTGVAEMDYLLGDSRIAPIEDESHFSEEIWRLPNSYLCFTPPSVAIEAGLLPALETHQVTFGCFNNLTKMNDAVVALWARVLNAVPGSRLFLKTKQLNDVGICEATHQKFLNHGITADRLILEGSSPRAELLAAYKRVDIGLDPFPYPGGTTSIEALWMGVPVLTKRGDRFLSHMGESIMYNADLSNWIANDDDDYVAKAVMHTVDLEKLAILRNGLRQKVLISPLFDAVQFALNFEAALWGMWQARGCKSILQHPNTDAIP